MIRAWSTGGYLTKNKQHWGAILPKTNNTGALSYQKQTTLGAILPKTNNTGGYLTKNKQHWGLSYQKQTKLGAILPNTNNTGGYLTKNKQHWGLSYQKQTSKVKLSLTDLGSLLGLQEVEAATFHYSRHMKVIRLSALPTGRLYPQKISLLLICVS